MSSSVNLYEDRKKWLNKESLDLETFYFPHFWCTELVDRREGHQGGKGPRSVLKSLGTLACAFVLYEMAAYIKFSL